MNGDNESPTPSPTAENNDMTFFVIIAFVDISILLFLYYCCGRSVFKKYFNRFQITSKINFEKYHFL